MIVRFAPFFVAILMSILIVIPFLQSEDRSLLTGAKVGGHFTLQSIDGDLNTASLDTTLFAIYFGYTYCPDVCPTELARMAQLLDGLGDYAKKITPIFVTVDPGRDSALLVNEYAKAFHPMMIGLSGSDLEIEVVKRQYQVYSQRIGEDENYLIDHSSRIYLMNSSAQLIALFSMETPVATMIKQTQNFM